MILLLPLRWQQVLNAASSSDNVTTAETPETARVLLHSVQFDDHDVSLIKTSSSVSRSNNYAAHIPHALLTAALVSTSMIIGIAVPNVEVVLAYKGALGGSCEFFHAC